ncbi:unnamed protein product [Linum tenue]|uniref:TPX2 C-terminal domain-containing protein n=1 Tax=Linum tenue TaxID=586396 RepID=A0AAV0LIC3_9ROSI|nr:unnamed protein product [Linum tenue]
MRKSQVLRLIFTFVGGSLMGRKLVNADMDEKRNGVAGKSNGMSQGGGARVSARSTSVDHYQGKERGELEIVEHQDVLDVKNTNNGNSEAARLQAVALVTEKHGDGNISANANNVLSPVSGKSSKSSPKSVRKVFRHDDKHYDEDDKCSVASSTAASVRTIKSVTVGTAPTFKSAERAHRRREFYTKLEEKHKALETEKSQAEARTKEEQQAAIRQMRKNMVFRANPVPNFYYEPPPPKTELKKLPLTRPVSPKLNRRKSCGDVAVSTYQEQDQQQVISKHCARQRHSLGSHAHKESPSGPRARTRTSSGGQTANGSTHHNKAKRDSGSEQHVTTTTTTNAAAPANMAAEQPSANISVES